MRNPNNLKTESADRNIGVGNSAARLRVLQRANDLAEDILALDDPAISRIYQMLKDELCLSTDLNKHAQAEEILELFAGQGARKGVDQLSVPDAARFVESFTRELVNICAKKEMKFLAYLLNMARTEAFNISEARPQN